MTRAKKKIGVIAWAVIHVALVALGLCVPWNIETDLYSVLPDSSEIKTVSVAEKALSARSMRNLTVLLGHENFEEALASARTLEESFARDSSFAETRLWVGDSAMRELQDFYFEYRNVLLPPDVRELLKRQAAGDTVGAETLKDLALQKVYGAFSIADLGRIEEDPYLLGAESFEYFTLNSPVMNGRFTVREGVLAAEDSSISYVMWSASLSANTSAMASSGHVLERLDSVLDSLQKVHAGLRGEKSGVPFHSYESSRNVQSEVAWISGVSMALILLLLLWVFRTPVPIVSTLMAIAVAVCAALSGTWAVFGSIHIFTFVFGTSVIGVSIDYAIHFFTERHHIFKGLLLGFMTTELSYVALTFADFPILRQMAVFSLIGLASSFATIVLLFPNLPFAEPSEKFPTRIPSKFMAAYDRVSPQKLRLALAVFVAALIPGMLLLNVHTDMRTLYAMSDSLKRSEALNARLNNLGVSANYFIVEGGSGQELLETEEALALRLKAAVDDSLMGGFLATSSYIPSIKTQRETFEGVRALQQSSAYRELLETLNLSGKGWPAGDHSGLAGAAPRYLTPSSKIPSSFASVLGMLWMGNVDGKFYSAVFPLHVRADFDIHGVASQMPHVYAVNKMENVNETLTGLSRVALLLVAFAYVVVLVVLIFVYGFRQALKVIFAPVVSCFFIAAVFGYLGIPFNFFAIVGVILTLGIGIDYALFFKEGTSRSLVTALAVMLSAATTLVSFGSLSFSSFVPVATFGLSVLLGIWCCFLLSPFSRK